MWNETTLILMMDLCKAFSLNKLSDNLLYFFHQRFPQVVYFFTTIQPRQA